MESIDCPTHIDINSSLYCVHDSLIDIYSIITKILEDQNIDYILDKNIVALTYIEYIPINFRINIFNNTLISTNRAKYIIEIQKRSGCCIKFRNIYRLLRELISQKFQIFDIDPLNLPINNKYKFPIINTQNYNLEINAISASNLVDMISSDCIPTSQEAFRALCHISSISASDIINIISSSPEMLDKYIKMLKIVFNLNSDSCYEQDQEIIRCAFCFVSNLISRQSSGPIYDAIFPNLDNESFGLRLICLCIAYLETKDECFHNTLLSREIRRQAAYLLYIIIRFNSSDINPIIKHIGLPIFENIISTEHQNKRLVDQVKIIIDQLA